MEHLDLTPYGLGTHESRTYLCLLKQKPLSVLEISRASGINRSMLYTILNRLVVKGLVHQRVREKKTHYTASDPTALEHLLSEKLQGLSALMPKLLTLAQDSSKKPNITFHEGIAGIKNVYLGSIRSKEKRLYAFVGVESLLSKDPILETFWDESFKRERRKHNVFGQLLIPNNAAGRAFQKKDNQNFRESRLVDTKQYNFLAEILMYDDTVSFISYTKDEELAVSLQSKAVAETLKMIWRFMWERSEG